MSKKEVGNLRTGRRRLEGMEAGWFWDGAGSDHVGLAAMMRTLCVLSHHE